MTKNEKDVLSYLSAFNRGRENSIPSKMLSLRLRMEDRAIREAVRGLRRQGYPIGSWSGGFWFIKDPEELRRTTANLKSRAFDMLRTVSIQERIPAAELLGQLKMALEETI